MWREDETLLIRTGGWRCSKFNVAFKVVTFRVSGELGTESAAKVRRSSMC